MAGFFIAKDKIFFVGLNTIKDQIFFQSYDDLAQLPTYKNTFVLQRHFKSYQSVIRVVLADCRPNSLNVLHH